MNVSMGVGVGMGVSGLVGEASQNVFPPNYLTINFSKKHG